MSHSIYTLHVKLLQSSVIQFMWIYIYYVYMYFVLFVLLFTLPYNFQQFFTKGWIVFDANVIAYET